MDNTLMHNTIVGTLWPTIDGRAMVRNCTLAFAGSVLLTLSSKIALPFYPVPMTMQTLVVLLIGMVYGWKLGGVTILLYLAEGAIGIPVFSGTPEKGAGIAYMLGGTGGYLFGFVCAATICGYLAERGWGKTFTTTAIAMLIGNLVIYIPGVLWLGSLYGWDKPILEWGLVPFILGDLVKLSIAVALLPNCWKLVERVTKRNK